MELGGQRLIFNSYGLKISMVAIRSTYMENGQGGWQLKTYF